MNEVEFEAEKLFYETALANINNQIDLITRRIENGTVLAYPKSYSNPELNQLYDQCTAKVEAIHERIQKLKSDFRNQSS